MHGYGATVGAIVVYVFALKPALALETDGLAAARPPCLEEEDAVSQRPLQEDFLTSVIDPCRWNVVYANWGGQSGGEDYNGGVSPDNVAARNGTLILRALGDRYKGPIRGIDSNGAPRSHGRRTGAAIKTRQRFRGGRFEARVRICDRLGVASAMWTFFYDAPPGGRIRNHEIDIEFPGQAAEGAPPALDHVTLTTWTGLEPGESTAAFRRLPASMADGRFHLLSFDWRPPDGGNPGVVTFSLDGVVQAVTRTNVPTEAANFWLGAWFPPNWAGTPDFVETEMAVDWVRITPLAQPGVD